MLLRYTVAKVPTSPRNSTWFTRPFLLVRSCHIFAYYIKAIKTGTKDGLGTSTLNRVHYLSHVLALFQGTCPASRHLQPYCKQKEIGGGPVLLRRFLYTIYLGWCWSGRSQGVPLSADGSLHSHFSPQGGLGFISTYIQRGGTKGACKWEMWFSDCSCIGAGARTCKNGRLE